MKNDVHLTIRDIAQMANTSTATVSRVLSGKPGVSEAKRKVIMDLARRVGYSPNRIAQNLALQKSHVLGFVAADLVNTIYVSFFRLLQRAAEELGYQVLIADSSQSVEKERYNIQVMRAHRAEGLIIFPVRDWHRESAIDHLLELRIQRFPFVLIGHIPSTDFDSVTNEEVESARRLAAKLIEQGHRRIGFVGSDPENRPAEDRLAGLRAALEQAGHRLDTAHVIPHAEGWQSAMVAMLRSPGAPTALVLLNDVVALLAHRALVDAGFLLPEDVSLATFGDGLWTRHLKPSLTTTRENNEQVARIAMDLLLKRIEEPNRPSEQHFVAQEIVERESIV